MSVMFTVIWLHCLCHRAHIVSRRAEGIQRVGLLLCSACACGTHAGVPVSAKLCERRRFLLSQQVRQLVRP